jgi:trans-aconitate methyltransferase
VGAGNGKYGRMIRQYFPDTVTIGLEIEHDYVDRFKLRDIYTQVIIADVMALLDQPDHHWDFVMLGDVLEHLRKSDGQDLLDYLMYRCFYMMIIYPDNQLQNSWEGYKAEAHLSVWRAPDFANYSPKIVPVEAPVNGGVHHKTVVGIDGFPDHMPRIQSILD